MAKNPLVDFHKQQLAQLRTRRTNFDTQWEEAAQRLIPAHVNTFSSWGLPHEFNAGQKNQEKMFDVTGALALSRFIAVMESLTMPQNALWHRLVPSEPELRKNRAVRLYLDRINQLLFRFRYRPSANFVMNSQKAFMQYGAYGNGALFIDELQSNNGELGLRYKNLHLGETYIAENHQGVIDTLYRVFRLENRQIVQQFENAPENIQKFAKSADMSRQKTEVVHVVTPRQDFNPKRLDAKGKPFLSMYYLTETEDVLREEGYRTFPMPFARYQQFVNEEYGRGPAQTVLPSIKLLQEEKKVVITQGHRTVDPILLMFDDGLAGTFDMSPGAFNSGGVTADGRPLVQTLPIGNIAVGKEMMDDERQAINDAFLLTLFQILVDNPQQTATEVLERAREKGMLVAPTAGALAATYLGPMINRELDVLFAQQLLPPPPGLLVEAGGGFQVEYDNPISRMARAENASGFMRALDTALNLAQSTGNPEPLDWFDTDAAMPDIMDISGAPAKWTRSLQAVQEIREGRARQAQTQQAIEAAPALAGVVKATQGARE